MINGWNLSNEWIHTKEVNYVAWAFAAFASFLSTMHVIQHLVNYSMPGIQVYVVRILFIVPVYAISSALAIELGNNGLYAETIRDVYEAFVLYSFLNLILEFCGGETDCIYQIENETPISMPFPLCFMGARPRDARLMRFCKRGVLQFIIIKPVMALLTLIMIATDNYFNIGYVVVETIVYNVSYGWALYCLLVFYMSTNQLIKKFKPLVKFSTVKVIIFATYYQSVAVKALPMSAEDGLRWNDLLICIEMVIFSVLLLFAFPIREFQGGIPDTMWLSNMGDVLNVRDMVQDVYHNFMPVYHDYVVQRSEFEAPETVRVKTFLAGNLDSVALEMTNRYRGRNKRLAFNTLLRGNNPLFARLRSEKRVTRDGISEHFNESEISPLSRRTGTGTGDSEDDLFRVFPEDEDLEVAIEFREKPPIDLDIDLANGILVTSVLDLVQDPNLPADARSLNFLPAHKVHCVYKSRVSGYQEELMQFDDEGTGIVNEIHMPYEVDPNFSTKSIAAYMKAVQKQTPLVPEFCEKRDYRELGKIVSRPDEFDCKSECNPSSREKLLVHEVEEVVANPMFECDWSSVRTKQKQESTTNSGILHPSHKSSATGGTQYRYSSSSTASVSIPTSTIPIISPHGGATAELTVVEATVEDIDTLESSPLVPNSIDPKLGANLEPTEWTDFQ